MRWWGRRVLLGLAQAPELVLERPSEMKESQWREWAKVKRLAVFQVPGPVTVLFSR